MNALEMALEALTNPSTIAVQHAIELIRAELAKPEQEPVAYVSGYHNGRCVIAPLNSALIMPSGIALYIAPQRKPWVGLTNEDWENTPNTGKQGCERDAELFNWVEQTLKDKNDTI